MTPQTQTKELPKKWKEEGYTEVEIFFDEIEPEKECNYLILGALFIQSKDKDKIINELLNFRCQNTKKEKWNREYSSCSNKDNCKSSWHDMNNTEIHFSQIRTGRLNRSQIKIAKNWLSFFIKKNMIYVAILYIDMNKLDTSFFGNRNINANIYNKFFRTIINYGLKCFFNSKHNKIKIKRIFYDKKEELERHTFFNNFNFDKLVYESKDNIELSEKVIFIDSDHKTEPDYKDESHLIQLIDLILGTVRQNIFYVSKDNVKNEISRVVRGELDKLKKEYWSLKYLRLSFFPKNKIKSVLDLQKNQTYERNDEFYSLTDMELKMPVQATNLNRWF